MTDDGVLIAYGACIRCQTLFAFDPDTVPSVSVHAYTSTCLRPDGTLIDRDEVNTHREPLCPPCEQVFQRPYRQHISVLFPYGLMPELVQGGPSGPAAWLAPTDPTEGPPTGADKTPRSGRRGPPKGGA